jgi:hypothetical protein
VYDVNNVAHRVLPDAVNKHYQESYRLHCADLDPTHKRSSALDARFPYRFLSKQERKPGNDRKKATYTLA